MAGLVLKLRAGERVLVNGAVIESVDRPCRLRVVTPNTDVLRMRDALDPTLTRTPVGRLINVVQAAVAGSAPAEAAAGEALELLAALQDAMRGPDETRAIATARAHVEAHRFYQALRAVRPLHAREAALLGAAE